MNSSSAPSGGGPSAGEIPHCGWVECGNRNLSAKFLKQCSRCKQTHYCSKECQKKAWKIHKCFCINHEFRRHLVEETTVEAIVAAVDRAQAGDVILIPSGSYKSATGEVGNIEIAKPIFLVGDGMDKTIIHAHFSIHDPAKVDGRFGVHKLTIEGTVHVQGLSVEVTFYTVAVKCPRGRADAVKVEHCTGKVVFLCCEVVGGADGLFLSCSPKAYIFETDIQQAQSRGIFADCGFVIEDSAIYNCGGYGIKGRGGWEERGTNDIQPGPWNSYGVPVTFF